MGDLDFRLAPAGEADQDAPTDDAPAANQQQTFTITDRSGKHTEEFRLIEDPSEFPLLALGSLADLDTNSRDPEEIIAVYGGLFDFLRALIEPADWRRFVRTATRWSLKIHDLYPVVEGIVLAVYGGPTRPSSDSQPTPSPSNGSSTDGLHLRPAATPAL